MKESFSGCGVDEEGQSHGSGAFCYLFPTTPGPVHQLCQGLSRPRESPDAQRWCEPIQCVHSLQRTALVTAGDRGDNPVQPEKIVQRPQRCQIAQTDPCGSVFFRLCVAATIHFMELMLVSLASFFAGFVDSIVGGGGLILVPALFAMWNDARSLLERSARNGQAASS